MHLSLVLYKSTIYYLWYRLKNSKFHLWELKKKKKDTAGTSETCQWSEVQSLFLFPGSSSIHISCNLVVPDLFVSTVLLDKNYWCNLIYKIKFRTLTQRLLTAWILPSRKSSISAITQICSLFSVNSSLLCKSNFTFIKHLTF